MPGQELDISAQMTAPTSTSRLTLTNNKKKKNLVLCVASVVCESVCLCMHVLLHLNEAFWYFCLSAFLILVFASFRCWSIFLIVAAASRDERHAFCTLLLVMCQEIYLDLTQDPFVDVW
jgi:hypothetical protein